MVPVFLTFDVECSLGGAWDNPALHPVPPERSILGKIRSAYYGTPLIMDILEENGLRGTFFVEVFAGLDAYRSELANAYQELSRRGHDVQLHLHPVHFYYQMLREKQLGRDQFPPDKDMIGSLPAETQRQLLTQGISLFQEMVGKSPIAFRAGNFGASDTTLDMLSDVGIHFDSSFNASYVQAGCRLTSAGTVNASWQHNGVAEVPVTNFRVGPSSLKRLKQLNINAVSLWEMTKVLCQAEPLGLTNVNFIGHSFSLFKVADVQFLKLRPDRLILRRFQGLCNFLKQHASQFRVITFSDIQFNSLLGAEKAVPSVGTVAPVFRKAIQAINRFHWV